MNKTKRRSRTGGDEGAVKGLGAFKDEAVDPADEFRARLHERKAQDGGRVPAGGRWVRRTDLVEDRIEGGHGPGGGRQGNLLRGSLLRDAVQVRTGAKVSKYCTWNSLNLLIFFFFFFSRKSVKIFV